MEDTSASIEQVEGSKTRDGALMNKVFLAQYWQIYNDEYPCCYNPTALCATRERAEQFIRETRQAQWQERIVDDQTDIPPLADLFFDDSMDEDFRQRLRAYIGSLEGEEFYPLEMPEDADICDYLMAVHFGYAVEIDSSIEERAILE